MIIRFGVMAFQVIGDAKSARLRTSQVSSDFGVDQWPVIESILLNGFGCDFVSQVASDCSSRRKPSETRMMIDP